MEFFCVSIYQQLEILSRDMKLLNDDLQKVEVSWICFHFKLYILCVFGTFWYCYSVIKY